ncbi:MAG: secondary thiamine-phosphate synthase enzyme YjbQ [Nanoarchaeota archaeon]|nr:secondary thiamine-phosphate synthase enzyme YjbQ [Nanoarchaeota archaeon]MBU1704581.1 secondary thiamine-phosphate synthase enzyme YjbQ [Nanoarchaeota archaeon]
MGTISISTSESIQIVDISSKVQSIVSRSGMKEGLCVIQSTHTTAGITVNENADPDVKKDMLKGLSVFDSDDYDHSEGNSAAHIKASLVGPSVSIIVEKGELQLGTWQGIMFCEFDGPRDRKIIVKVIGNGNM